MESISKYFGYTVTMFQPNIFNSNDATLPVIIKNILSADYINSAIYCGIYIKTRT